MRLSPPLATRIAIVLIAALPGLASAARPELDAARLRPASPEAAAHLHRIASDPALARLGVASETDDRIGVPTFLWANRTAPPATSASRLAAGTRPTPAVAARAHLAHVAPLYRLGAADVATTEVRDVHDTGRGGVIVTFRQKIGGIEVFRDEMKVMMDRNLDLLTVSGYVPGQSSLGKAGLRAFRLGERDAIGKALDDFSGAGGAATTLRALAAGAGGYGQYEAASSAGLSRPVRIKKVLFHLPDALEPGYYVEVMSPTDAAAYVVSAIDGSVLFRHSQIANDSYSYRVWASAAASDVPHDGPAGTSPSPHPTGNPDYFHPSYVAPSLLTLQNGPIATNDPWLPPGATQTTGNNVDAYADIASPDGFSGGDLRATTTALNTFDRTYDLTQQPNASTNQQMAAITQLFYTTNFFHDWYYDSGFDEASGNAQTNNFGRGGVGGDALHAEAQDFSGTNNANMSTPADGASPRMQMYVFNSEIGPSVRVNSPASVASNYQAGVATGFGPQAFGLTGQVVLVNDGVAPTSDACSAITNSVAGKIALIDRSSTCAYTVQVQNAQNAGAIGVIIANNLNNGTPPTLSGSLGGITIPVLSVTLAVGTSIKNNLGFGVNVSLIRGQMNRDGSIDNQIVAHEWGHYISNRLIGDGSGLGNQQGAGMGEGWGDFHSMLMTVRGEDAAAPANANFSGVYGLAGYALTPAQVPSNYYYFGIRRYPYSTDMTKNPLTFKHIQNGVPLPSGPPVAFGQDGSSNAEVHNAGEVWCTMLWECYASLLRDTGRLTFAQAQSRMKDYLVAAYKLTPSAPTFLEARDAVLAAAYANDPADFALFWSAFAKRGAGVGAVAPPRESTNDGPLTESFSVGGDLAFVSASLKDDITSCDADSYVDNGEAGHLVITLENIGSTTLSGTTATVTSTNPAVSFPAGNTVSFSASGPYGVVAAPVVVKVTGAVGTQALDFHIAYNDPGLLVAGPRNAPVYNVYGNVDVAPSTLETVEASAPPWTYTGDPNLLDTPWSRSEISPTDHRFLGQDPSGLSDQSLVSPPLAVANSGTFTFSFTHRFQFESDLSAFYDGGVLELTNNGGGTWTDIGASASPGYGGTIFVGANNPLSGRLGYVGTSAGFGGGSTIPVTVNLGTAYQGQTVQVRFRVGSDEAASGFGWEVDNLQFTNITNQPFFALVPDPGPCAAASVDGELPHRLSFALATANPVSGPARFHFALPATARVSIAVFDVGGRRVATLADGTFGAGEHDATWARTGAAATAAGVYFAHMTVGDEQLTQRIVLVR